MEGILAQMQSVILAEHNAKIRSLEKECAALRQALADKESVLAGSQSTKKRRRCAETDASERSMPVLGCGTVLCGLARAVKVIEESGTELTIHIHDDVLQQVPYFAVARDFAEKAGAGGKQLHIELPIGCSCECANLVLWRLYLGDDHPLGSYLPVSDLAEALAIGKLADMLMLESLFKEIDNVARRFAFRARDPGIDLQDSSLPEFLRPLAAQMMRPPQLSESDIEETFKNAAATASAESRSQAEELFNTSAKCAAPLVSALSEIARKMLTNDHKNWRDRLLEEQRASRHHEPLSWLLEVSQLYIEDPAVMIPFFEEVSIMQTQESWGTHSGKLSFGGKSKSILQNAFKEHLERCRDRESLSNSVSIAMRSKDDDVRTCNLLGPVRKQFSNVLAAELLDNALFPCVLARGSILGCRPSIMKHVFDLPSHSLQHVCSPEFLALLTPEEQLEICKQIVAGGGLQTLARVPIISALALDARQFLCAKLFTTLGYLADDVREVVVKEMR